MRQNKKNYAKLIDLANTFELENDGMYKFVSRNKK